MQHQITSKLVFIGYLSSAFCITCVVGFLSLHRFPSTTPLLANMEELFQPDDSGDMNRPPLSPRNLIPPKQPTIQFTGDSRYLTSLQVYIDPREKPHGSYLSQSESMDLELEANRYDPDHKKIQDKITASLKLLAFREQHVLVQFWGSREVGTRQLLTTLDQPFGFGVIDERLWSYRRDSERNSFVVDKDHEEVDCHPAARVFRRGLPEWTSDLDSYTSKHFPQQECAIRCNLHGYLGLPVFDSNTRLCVGVLEVLTSAKYMSYAYEVQRIHNALETVDLRTQQAFDSPFLNVPNERRQNDFDKIHGILKTLSDIYNLPLAQTWAVSQHSSFVSHEKVIVNSCSSFNTKCLGKVCMSTAALPSYVKDLRTWDFRQASREQHLDRSRGLVGRALSSRGSCFCEDVTRLSEEEYLLVHNARMNGLTGCFAISLHSVEANDDYVLEFYLPPNIKERRHVLNLVQTFKQNIQFDSGFELGDTSSIEYVGPLTDVSQISSDSVSGNVMFMSSSDSEPMYSSDSESLNSPATTMVTANITFNDDMQIFHFPISLGLSNLKNEVAHIFELEGHEIRLKYTDEENDRILVANDVDLKFAVDTVGINNRINLICQPGI